jgi:hypothetical protein
MIIFLWYAGTMQNVSSDSMLASLLLVIVYYTNLLFVDFHSESSRARTTSLGLHSVVISSGYRLWEYKINLNIER